jgi:hypothetical protein
MNTTVLLSVLLGGLLAAPLWCQPCQAGSANIYFGNGVNNTFPEALASLQDLTGQVEDDISHSQSISLDCIGFSLAYDSKFFDQYDNNSSPLEIFNYLLQIVESSGIQVTEQLLSQLWLWAGDDGVNGPSWFDQVVANAIVNASAIAQGDLAEQVQAYKMDIQAGTKDILVAHSQGNLYGNQAYAQLSPSNDQFSMISVATPANTVSGGGPYMTLYHDIILLVPGSLDANTSNDPGPDDPCGSNNYISVLGILSSYSLACHSFPNSYLTGSNSDSAILADVVAAIPIVLGVATSGTGTGSVSSSPSGISCAFGCTSQQAAFEGGTSVTLTATADQGSTFSGWTGNCAPSGSINSSVTFSVFYDPTGNVITSYPESCTATFTLQQTYIATIGPADADHPLDVTTVGASTSCIAGGSYPIMTNIVYTQPGFPAFTWPSTQIPGIVSLVKNDNGQWVPTTFAFTTTTSEGEVTNYSVTVTPDGILTSSIMDTYPQGQGESQTSGSGTLNLNTGSWSTTLEINYQDPCNTLEETEMATANVSIVLTSQNPSMSPEIRSARSLKQK